MSIYRSAAAGTAGTVLCLLAGTALADVTPAEVWDDWKLYMTGFGYDVAAEETQSGDDLVLRDLVMRFNAPEGMDEDAVGDTVVTLPELSLKDNGDGTVSIEFPQEFPMSVSLEGPEPVSFDILYSSEDMDITVSGTPSEMVYDYTASAIGLKLADLVADGAPVPSSADIRIEDVSGQSATDADDLRRTRQTLTSGTVVYNIEGSDPENAENRFAVSGSAESLAFEGSAALPGDMQMENVSAALAAGFAVDGTYTFGPSASKFTFTEEGQATSGTSQSGGGELSVSMDEGRLRYAAKSRDLEVEMVPAGMPFPVSLAMQEAAFDLHMPLTQRDEPQDFGLSLMLGDIEVGDRVWTMFDPDGKLPRDPATLALDLSGKARVLADWMDPAQMAAIEEEEGEMPAELDELSIDRLELRAAGTELTGEGGVTFDNSDKESYGGMPKPVGDVSLRLTGANRLLDTLVEMGLVPQDQVMGMRMMIGMIAVPAEGEDTLKSDIEFTEDGQILANGQRLK